MKKLRSKVVTTVHKHHPDIDIDGSIWGCICGEFLADTSVAVFMDHVASKLLDAMDELEKENAEVS